MLYIRRRHAIRHKGGIIMAFVYCDKIGGEKISPEKPMRIADFWISKQMLNLPKGSIKKLIGRELNWNDEPVKLKEE